MSFSLFLSLTHESVVVCLDFLIFVFFIQIEVYIIIYR